MTAPDPRLGEIEDRLSQATPGPWRWRNTNGEPMLLGGPRLVMGFSRMGMNGAQPEFRDWDGLMVKAGKENINAYPDAEFIANAPADVAYLLAELRKAQDALGRVEGLARSSKPLQGLGGMYSGIVMADHILAAVAAATGGGE